MAAGLDFGKCTLIPCILFHAANNALKVFSAEGSLDPKVETVLNLVLIVVVLGGYSFYLVRAFVPRRELSRKYTDSQF